MANTSDGSVYIDVNLDSSKAQKSIEKLEAQMSKQTTQIIKQTAEVKKLEEQYNRVASGGDKATKLQSQLASAKEEVARLNQAFDSLLESEQKALSEQQSARASFLKGGLSWEEYDKAADAFNKITNEVDQTGAKIRETEEEIKRLNEELAKVQLDASTSSQAEQLRIKLEAAKQVLGQYQEQATHTSAQVEEAYKSVATSAETVNTAFEGTAKTLEESKDAIKSMESQADISANAIEGTFTKMANRISSMLKRKLYYLAVFQSISTLIDGFKELAETNDEVNESVSELYSSLTYLKNSFINAFLPILKAITPILVTIIDAVAELFNLLGRLFALLTGTSWEDVTKESLDYAASLEDVEESAEDAKKALASFDELNILDFGDDTNSSDSSSGDSSSGDSTGKTWDFDIPDLSGLLLPFNNFIDMLPQFQEALANAWDAVKEWADNLATVTLPDWLTDVITVPAPELALVTDALAALQEAFANAWEYVTSLALEPVTVPALDTSLVTSALPAFQEAFATTWDYITALALTPLAVPALALDAILSSITALAAAFNIKLPSWLTEGITVPELATELVTEGIAGLQSAFESGWEIIKTIALAPITVPAMELAAALGSIDELESAYQGMVQKLDSILGDIFPSVQGVFQNIKTFMSEFGTWLQTDPEKAWQYLVVSIGEAHESMIETVRSGWLTISNGILAGCENIMQNAYSTLQWLGESIYNVLSSGLQTISDWVVSTSYGFVQWKISVIDTVKGALSSLWSGIVSFVNAALSKLDDFLSWLGINVSTSLSDGAFSMGSSAGTAAGVAGFAGGITAFGGLSGIASLFALAFANGGVVQPNHELLAILGDNKTEPEVVSPISTMKQAFTEALQESNFGSGNGTVILNLDGKELARATYPYNQAESLRRGTTLITRTV